MHWACQTEFTGIRFNGWQCLTQNHLFIRSHKKYVPGKEHLLIAGNFGYFFEFLISVLDQRVAGC